MSHLEFEEKNDEELETEEANSELSLIDEEVYEGEGFLADITFEKYPEESFGEEEDRHFEVYGEGGIYLKYTDETHEYAPSLWEGERSSLEASDFETEEEELRRERELLVNTLKRKIYERMILRRKNMFLQKKLHENLKKRRLDQGSNEEIRGMDLDSKYLKRLYVYQEFKNAQENEIEELTLMMKNYEQDTKLMEVELSEMLTSFSARAKEISLNLISSKTGKKLNEKAVDRLLRRILQKNLEKGKNKYNFIKLRSRVEEKERKLKSLEYFGDGLHIVDFEQLKIDNQNYSDKTEEKEEELSKMRIKTYGIIQNLTHVREKMYAVEGDIELMREKVYEVEKKFREARESLTKARKERDTSRESLSHLKSESGLLTRDDLLEDFEKCLLNIKSTNSYLETTEKLIPKTKGQTASKTKTSQEN